MKTAVHRPGDNSVVRAAALEVRYAVMTVPVRGRTQSVLGVCGEEIWGWNIGPGTCPQADASLNLVCLGELRWYCLSGHVKSKLLILLLALYAVRIKFFVLPNQEGFGRIMKLAATGYILCTV